MITIGTLKEWLEDLPAETLKQPVDLMIETGIGQWQFSMTDMAHNGRKLILLSEFPENTEVPK